MPMNLQDTALSVSVALPAASGTAHTSAIDLTENVNQYVGISNTADFLAQAEAIVTIPALTTTQLPDADTFTYTLEHSASSGSGYSTLASWTQTGAGGAGDAGSTKRFRFAENVSRYTRLTIVSGSGTAATAASGKLTLVF